MRATPALQKKRKKNCNTTRVPCCPCLRDLAHLLPPPLPLKQAANKARVGGADGSALPNASVRLVVVDALRQHQPRDRQRARSDWPNTTAVRSGGTRRGARICCHQFNERIVKLQTPKKFDRCRLPSLAAAAQQGRNPRCTVMVVEVVAKVVAVVVFTL